MTFVYLIRPTRPDFVSTATDAEMEVIGRHFDFLKAGFDAGKVSFIGRCEDGAFGMCLFVADDFPAARAWAEQDPAVVEGVFALEVREFRVILKAP
jgi:uncharacterized protein YciI